MEMSTVDKPGVPVDNFERVMDLREGDEKHLTVPHKLMNWPMINDCLNARGTQFAQDLRDISLRGTPWLVERSKWTTVTTTPASISTLRQATSVSSTPPIPARTHATCLLHQCGEVTIKGYVDAYFRTFNKVRPILEQEFFTRETELQLKHSANLGREAEGVLLLLVIALGEVAYEGAAGAPIESFVKRSSGIRGGTASLSPGATCFEEASRRWALIPSSSSLLSIQVLLLQASFYESSARHWDFWRCAVAASASCEQLIKERSFHWSTPSGEMLKRAYWACVLDEGYYHHDLDLPETGIFSFQDDVPLPTFVQDIDKPTIAGNGSPGSPVAYLHFLALISLKRLVDRIHDVVHESILLDANQITHHLHPPRKVLSELSFQLRQWRLVLPLELQWPDNRRNELSDPMKRFTHEANISAFDFDVMLAQLRARFYNARFTLLSPFLYLALHNPELLSSDDTQYCISALESTLLWPLSAASVPDHKRLLSHHFTWTQNAISFLCIFAMIGKNRTLKEICEQHLNLGELRISVAVQLAWLQDMKAIDGIADWAWRLLHPLFIERMVGLSRERTDGHSS